MLFKTLQLLLEICFFIFVKVHGEYLDPSVISGQTQVTAVGADSVLILDATDNALKKALLSDVIETVRVLAKSLSMCIGISYPLPFVPCLGPLSLFGAEFELLPCANIDLVLHRTLLCGKALSRLSVSLTVF